MNFKQRALLAALLVIAMLVFFVLDRKNAETNAGSNRIEPPVAVQPMRHPHAAQEALEKHPVAAQGRGDLIHQGALEVSTPVFMLHGKEIQIFSGAIHYFRVPPTYWQDRLRKAKAMGLNTVETYIPWNFHEAERGVFDFSSPQRDLRRFLMLAQEEGLHMIVRPSPFICAEWEWGGHPSWLLEDPKMEIRGMYPGYIKAVSDYYDQLIPLLLPLQAGEGGPIIAFQIENEYGSYRNNPEYMEWLADAMISRGISETLMTSDNNGGLDVGGSFRALKTINFQNDPAKHLQLLSEAQPNRPRMVMEFWSGWFDHWGEQHQTRDSYAIAAALNEILLSGASVNLYMFHGGTNFGLMNGANNQENRMYASTVTSYDYDAPVAENGEITTKYHELRTLFAQAQGKLPEQLPIIEQGPIQTTYPAAEMSRQRLGLFLLLGHPSLAFMHKGNFPETLWMEDSRIKQSVGFIVYQTTVTARGHHSIILSQVRDRARVFINEEWHATVSRWDTGPDKRTIVVDRQTSTYTLTIMVENLGRVNYGQPPLLERKGLGGLSVDGAERGALIKTYSLDFSTKLITVVQEIFENLDGVVAETDLLPEEPSFTVGTLLIPGEPADTHLLTTTWSRGVMCVNGEALGRYNSEEGPTKTLYVPAPMLDEITTFVVFESEMYPSPSELRFTATPAL